MIIKQCYNLEMLLWEMMHLKIQNELQVVLEPHQDSRKNRVGRIIEEELVLLEFIKPWTKFRFIEK